MRNVCKGDTPRGQYFTWRLWVYHGLLGPGRPETSETNTPLYPPKGHLSLEQDVGWVCQLNALLVQPEPGICSYRWLKRTCEMEWKGDQSSRAAFNHFTRTIATALIALSKYFCSSPTTWSIFWICMQEYPEPSNF